LYEDQIGAYDWRHQYVGRPNFSHIDTSMNKLFVGTDRNVLAALNLESGKIAWRKIFETNSNGNIENILWAQKEIVVVTGAGKRIQGFGYKHGFATWEYTLFNDLVTDSAKIIGIESKQDKDSYYFTNGVQLCYVGIKDKACVDLPLDGGYEYNMIFENEQGQGGVIVIGHKDNLVQKLHYNSLISSLISKTISTESGHFSFKNCAKSLHSNDLACYLTASKKMYVSQVKSKLEFEEIKLTGIDAIDATLIWSTKDTFLLKVGNHLYLFNKQGSIINKYESPLAYTFLVKDSNELLVYAKYLDTYKKLNIVTIDLKTGLEKPDLLVSTSHFDSKEPKSILMIDVDLVESRNSQISLSVLCFFEDYTMLAFDAHGNKNFAREESLAYIVTVEMVDFPLLSLQEEFEDEFGKSQKDNIVTMFLKRIRAQFVQLREFLIVDLYQKAFNYLNNNNVKRAAKTGQDPTSDSSVIDLTADEITREPFNLNKLIVAVTRVGKVFGIYTSANGKILWSFYLKDTLPFEDQRKTAASSIPLFVQRTTAHYPHEPQCVLVSKTLVDQQVKTRIYYFNPITGRASKGDQSQIVDYQVKQVFISNKMDDQFLKPLIIFDHDKMLHIMPETLAATLTVNSKKTATLFSVLTNREQSSLIGYAMRSTSEPLPEVWRINLENELVIALGAKLPQDHIHSHGKVLGDRSVLYKYLNPNMIAVVTQGQDLSSVAFINVYLVDTITGSIVNSFHHKKCKGPVNIVHSENWFFYSYYNIKYRRNEVASVELFEGNTQHNSTHFSALNNIKPLTFTKSYIVQKKFDSMQITVTEKGITTKDVIVACQFGVLIEIPWILIDPRRPVKMTELDREEQLIPYMPEIPLNYEFSLNYYNYVYNIQGIATSASGLESTSLVFVYGLDLFYTRVFPSKTFDMIREDFDYFFISTLIIGLVLGTILTKKLASNSNLKKAWK
jgi:hypothetical protein